MGNTFWISGLYCWFQDLVAELCAEYFQRFRRQTHVTPKSYLSFIAGYKELYRQKREEIEIMAQRMKTGNLVLNIHVNIPGGSLTRGLILAQLVSYQLS